MKMGLSQLMMLQDDDQDDSADRLVIDEGISTNSNLGNGGATVGGGIRGNEIDENSLKRSCFIDSILPKQAKSSTKTRCPSVRDVKSGKPSLSAPDVAISGIVAENVRWDSIDLRKRCKKLIEIYFYRYRRGTSIQKLVPVKSRRRHKQENRFTQLFQSLNYKLLLGLCLFVKCEESVCLNVWLRMFAVKNTTEFRH